MKAATINEVKQELSQLPARDLVEICLRLGKFKQENKELLTFLLFEAYDELGYTNKIKSEIGLLFEEMNCDNLYFAKKTIRKILRFANKHIRYMGSKTAEVELLAQFCLTLRESGLPFQKSPVLNNLYINQIRKIHKALATLHEDLQYEYRSLLQKIELD